MARNPKLPWFKTQHQRLTKEMDRIYNRAFQIAREIEKESGLLATWRFFDHTDADEQEQIKKAFAR